MEILISKNYRKLNRLINKSSSFTNTNYFIEYLETYIFNNKNKNTTLISGDFNIDVFNANDNIYKYSNALAIFNFLLNFQWSNLCTQF